MDGDVIVWNILMDMSLTPKYHFFNHKSKVTSACFNNKCRLFATCSNDGSCNIYYKKTG